jgi:SAM-dependent methyltransferase
MLRIARQKSADAGIAVRWVEGDIRSVRAGEGFDAGLFMFSVLGYLLPNDDVLAALGNARRHVRAGGLLIFDVWFGPAVLSIRPSDRAKVVSVSGGEIIRIVTPRLNVLQHTCAVHYHTWRLVGNHVVGETEELHQVRYFFPMELELMLSESGFAPIVLAAFPSLDRRPDETTWNVYGVGLAI